MIRVKRIIAALLCAVCVLTFASCSDRVQGVDRPGGKTAVVLTEESSDFKLEITEEEYDYYYLNFLAEGIGSEDAKEKALDELKRIAAVYSLAKEHEVELDSDARKTVEAEVDAAIEQVGGEKKFKEGLAEFNMTEDIYISLSQMNSLEIALRDYITDKASGVIRSDDVTVEADIKENFIAAKQILISNDEGDDPDQNRALAADIAAKLADGADFDEFVSEYGEDENMDAEYGRYFTAGMFPDAFEEAAEDLSVGEMSGVVESDVGFHIILRMPVEDEYINENFNTLRYYYLNRTFNEMLEERAENIKAEFKD
ncbi:MAG: peptidylprolyl isomerase [Clostridia bacterium]|nr:peptidylprolyl isomerase [Clostridia bacterium]